jgi:CTP synthase (UTP-ammonia lyase)
VIRVGLIGDHDPTVTAHRAIAKALELAARSVGAAVEPVWVATETIETRERVAPFDAIWCVPASPYRSTDGALRAIRFARESGRPFLGTCGGFQHALLEYARNVLALREAAHAELEPHAELQLLAPLACSLVAVKGRIRLLEGSRLHAIYGVDRIEEEYHCRYGLNPRHEALLDGGPLRVSARDETGEVRAVELAGHPFFVATLFQPERAALRGVVPPLALALVAAATRGVVA